MQPFKYTTYGNPSDAGELGELKPPNIGDDFEAKVDAILNKPNSNFKYAPRIKYSELTEELFEQKVIKEGIPLVVEDVTKGWNRELFSWNWLRDNFGSAPMINSPRDTEKLVDLENWTVSAYVDYFLKPEKERPHRLYGKDVTCPEPWRRYLAEKLRDYFCYEHNDLVSDIDKELQPVTLMVYIGPEKVWTPGHKDICGSLGHNVMVYAEPEAFSMWFCVGNSDKDRAADLWKSNGGMLDHDNCFLSPEQLSQADCPIYVVKQREGDFVLVPPESPHQVVNLGGRQIKIAWNRITPSTIGLSYHNVLPLYHSMCKAEVYRIKTIAYYAMVNRRIKVQRGDYDKKLLKELPPLLRLVDEIVESEYVDPKAIKNWGDTFTTEKFTDTLKHSRTCNYCNCDIFFRCYHCNLCKTDYDVCLDCVAETRGCIHNAQLKLMEYLSRKQVMINMKLAVDAYEKLCAIHKVEVEFIEKFSFSPNHTVATLAYNFVRHNTRQNKVPCHQCKIAKKSQFIVRCNTCSFHYCAMCLWNRYAIKFVDASKDSVWTCPSCRKTCNCAACLRKRGLNPKEYSESVVAENNFIDVTVVLPPAFERSSEAVMGVNDVKPRGVTPSATAYSQQDIERKKLLRKLKLKEGENGTSPAVPDDSPEVVNDEASEVKKRRGTKRKRSSVPLDLDEDEPRPKRRRTRELARELLDLTGSSVSVESLLSLLQHPQASTIVKTALNKNRAHSIDEDDSEAFDHFEDEIYLGTGHDSVMLDLVALELKEMEKVREEQEQQRLLEEQKKLKEEKEEKEEKQTSRRRGLRNSTAESNTNNNNNNNNDNTKPANNTYQDLMSLELKEFENMEPEEEAPLKGKPKLFGKRRSLRNSTDNNTNSLASSADDTAMQDIAPVKSSEPKSVKEEPEALNDEDGKRTRRGRKTSLPAKYADSVSLDTSVKLPQAPILNEDDDDEASKEVEKPKEKEEKSEEKEDEKEEKEEKTKKEKRKSPRGRVPHPRMTRKSDPAEAEKQKQKKKAKEEEMKKLRHIFRHIEHVFNEEDFDDVVFIKMNGYPQWPAAVIKVEAEPRLPGRILRYKTPKRGEELRCVVFLCDPKAPYTWQPAYNFRPLDEVNMQECIRALRLKLGLRLGESLEDAARLRKYLHPEKGDLLPYVHEYRKQHDPHYNPTPTPDPQPEAETADNGNDTEPEGDDEHSEEKPSKEVEIKTQESEAANNTNKSPAVESERATRAKNRRSSSPPPTVPAASAATSSVTSPPTTTGRGGRRKKSEPTPVETPKPKPEPEPVAEAPRVVEVKPSVSSIESTDAQQTSSAESTTIDLTVGEVMPPFRSSDEEAVLNVLLELAAPGTPRPNTGSIQGDIESLVASSVKKYQDRIDAIPI
eukprot:TRINITY_DN456_c0_g1_i1.p1 TRINITY_DN456_c0_g1~~TRINITY_DN456_c0_g1_i1.p1  ORF type:complete len:1376 (+),score=450.52 TRINITY_DN456_c0_g1_i1:223-4350(+)